ncbi:hypothetical protein SAMN05216228_1018114 [Rhizobium tibeticum]|uniref:Uncharacterized protein n=1 Tax=Rhizobium tibeticum TaxID=501024 RepID=A0A1H8Q9X6_9HYPH|nr:hypothetical protein RTCCBAU85039_0335 [Rhizobium tibeticum]SEO50818.1 hypothetical protein SAMN05216228_1018114 [Rhizobium tibeticum]
MAMRLALYGAAAAAFGERPHLMAADELGLYLSLKCHDLVADLSFGAAEQRQLVRQPAAFRLPEAHCVLTVATIQLGRTPINVTGTRSDRENNDLACRHCLQSFV